LGGMAMITRKVLFNSGKSMHLQDKIANLSY